MRDVYIYQEEGWIAEVEVPEDNTDDGWYRYKLKVLRTINPSSLFGQMPDGHIFDVCFNKAYMAYCNWRLSKVNQPQFFSTPHRGNEWVVETGKKRKAAKLSRKQNRA